MKTREGPSGIATINVTPAALDEDKATNKSDPSSALCSRLFIGNQDWSRMTFHCLTLRDLFVCALDRFDAQPAVTSDGVTASYHQVVQQANGLAAFLRDNGITPGVPSRAHDE